MKTNDESLIYALDLETYEILSELFHFDSLEIDIYEKNPDYELITFDLAAQNTGNIFTYKYYPENNLYELCDMLLYSYHSNNEFIGLPVEVLDEIFNIARSNEIVQKKRLINNSIQYSI